MTSCGVNPATSSMRYTKYQKRYSKRLEMMKLKIDQIKKEWSDECLESFSDKEEESSQPSKGTDSIVVTKSTDIEQRYENVKRKWRI